MTQDEWIKIFFGLAGGGLVGSLITNLWTEWRNRISPISYRIENNRLFNQNKKLSSLQASITVLHDNESFSFNNLSVAQVKLSNRGNKDLESLTYGISVDGANKIIFAELEGQDRHHLMTSTEVACPSNPLTKMDFICKPFHRENTYNLKLYIITSEEGTEPANINLTSPDPVCFTEMPSIEISSAEIIKIASAIAVNALIGRYR
jgi:hypothetical protein